MENTLYYGDNLGILRDHVKDESVDLIYLDPPFNSKTSYNILFKETTGEPSKAQITAFEDTWHWGEEAERTVQEIVETAPPNVVEMMRSFLQFVGRNDMMAYLTMMCIRLLELHRALKPTGSIYLHCDPTASHYLKILMDAIFGKNNFRNEIVWHYRRWTSPARRFQKLHDIVLFYTKGDNYTFNTLYTEYTAGSVDRKIGGVLHRFKKGEKPVLVSDKEISEKGVKENDVWHIPFIAPSAKERLGYPTQKPEALLERIIKASSNEGDSILDPFCGCGTTIAVAQKLNRRWIGIDVTHLAINLIKLRLKDMFGLEVPKDYTVVGEPEDLSAAQELAHYDRFQFQWWATSLIDARPYGDKKKGADTGIDGLMFFMDGEKDVKKVIVSVKSGKVSVKDMRDLGHVIDREAAAIGIFVTLEPPTKPMSKEATMKGFYKSTITGKNYSKIQILTIKDILGGKKPDVPEHYALPGFKKAQEAETKSEKLKF